jgi:hypothetical protein
MKRLVSRLAARRTSRHHTRPSVDPLEARRLLSAIQLGDFRAVVYTEADSVQNNTPRSRR